MVTEQSQDVKCSPGNMVDAVVITVCGARWVPETSGEAPRTVDDV